METIEKNKLEMFRIILRKFMQKDQKLSKKEIQVPERIEGFGKLDFDADKCWGCAACIIQCPEGALEVFEGELKRVIVQHYWKCVACGDCVDSCPKEAIIMQKIFDLAAFLKDDLLLCVEVEIIRCPKCGGVIAPKPIIKEVVGTIDELKMPKYLKSFSELCEDCRRELVVNTLLISRGEGR